MAQTTPSAAQQSAQAQAFVTSRAYFQHRSQLQSLLAARPGMCMANGMIVQQQTFDGDFDLDEPLVQRLLQGVVSGHVMRAAPAPAARPAAPAAQAPAGPNALQRYLDPPRPAGAPWTAQRLGEEAPGAAYGAGNLLGNAAAVTSGTLRGLAERDLATRLREGIETIRSGAANRVRLTPMLELYNTARPQRPPVVRLRVRGLPITVLQQSIPALGGVQSQWRANPSQQASTLPTRNMTSQQVRNTALLAAEHGQPAWLRWTQGRVGGGVLAFAPSAAIDLYNATDVDLRRREFNFNGRQFLVESARSQTGNLAGFAGGAIAVVVAGGVLAGAPLVLFGLGAGIVAQVAWNWSGRADQAAGAMEGVLK